MNISINVDGTVTFKEDLAEWARRFHNGNSHTVRCAGTVRMSDEKSRNREPKKSKEVGKAEGLKTEVVEIIENDSKSSNDSQYDLEKWLNRNEM